MNQTVQKHEIQNMYKYTIMLNKIENIPFLNLNLQYTTLKTSCSSIPFSEIYVSECQKINSISVQIQIQNSYITCKLYVEIAKI